MLRVAHKVVITVLKVCVEVWEVWMYVGIVSFL